MGCTRHNFQPNDDETEVCTHCNEVRARVISRSQSKRLAAQITHWDGCWADGPRHYECAVRQIDRLTRRVAKWREAALMLGQLQDELRAAREVVEAARDLDVPYSGARKRIKAALAAYDAARNEQPSPENQSGSQAGSAATGTGSASTNDNEDREVKQ